MAEKSLKKMKKRRLSNGKQESNDHEGQCPKYFKDVAGSRVASMERCENEISKSISFNMGSPLVPSSFTPKKQSKQDISQPSPDSGYTPSPYSAQNSILSTSSGIGTDLSECGTPCIPHNSSYSSFNSFKDSPAFPLPCPVNLKNILQTKFVHLKEELDSTIAGSLYEKGVISLRQLDDVKAERSINQKNETLIKAIASPKNAQMTDTYIITNIIKALEDNKCYHLVKMFKEKHKTEEENPSKNTLTQIEITNRLHKHCTVLEDEIDPRFIIDELVVLQVLTLDEHTNIKNIDHKPKKMKSLMKYVIRKPENFGLFCDVLGHVYPDMMLLLLQTEMETSTKQETTKIHASLSGTIVEKDCQGTHDTDVDSIKWNFEGEVREVRETEQMIVDEYNNKPSEELTEEAMDTSGCDVDSITFSCVKLNLKSLSHMGKLKFLERCRTEPHFQEKWIKHTLSKKGIDRLEKAGTKKVSFEIIVKLPARSEVKCGCKISSSNIVMHFSKIEKSLMDVRNIAESFVKYSVFKDEDITEIQSKPTTREQNQCFLMKVLDVKGGFAAVGVCLFERMLRETSQDEILKLVRETGPSKSSTTNIESKHIRQHYSFLQEQIEPKHFVESITAHLPRSSGITDQVMNTHSRRERCRILLDYIIKEGKVTTDWFISQLERNDMTYILGFMQPTVKDNLRATSLKESILSVYKTIIDEVEPKVLRPVFVERRIIKATIFDNVTKYPSRRARAVWFMKEVMSSNVEVQQCFVDALEVMGYENIAAAIKIDMDAYKPCPRFSPEISDVSKDVTIKGELDVSYSHGVAEESSLQIFLHKMLYAKSTEEAKENDSQKEVSEKCLPESPIPSHTDKVKDWLNINNKVNIEEPKIKLEDYSCEEEPATKKPKIIRAIVAEETNHLTKNKMLPPTRKLFGTPNIQETKEIIRELTTINTNGIDQMTEKKTVEIKSVCEMQTVTVIPSFAYSQGFPLSQDKQPYVANTEVAMVASPSSLESPRPRRCTLFRSRSMSNDSMISYTSPSSGYYSAASSLSSDISKSPVASPSGSCGSTIHSNEPSPTSCYDMISPPASPKKCSNDLNDFDSPVMHGYQTYKWEPVSSTYKVLYKNGSSSCSNGRRTNSLPATLMRGSGKPLSPVEFQSREHRMVRHTSFAKYTQPLQKHQSTTAARYNYNQGKMSAVVSNGTQQLDNKVSKYSKYACIEDNV